MSASGEIITVLGPIPANELGVTLMHEHLFIDLTCNFVYPDEATRQAYIETPVRMEILGLLRRFPFSLTLDNLRLFDEEVAREEVLRFKLGGGNAIVDCTVIGLRQDPLGLRRLARSTNLHIIQGTGVYVEPAHPDWIEQMGIDDIAELFVRDIEVGIRDTGVRAGFIGEIGTSGISKKRTDYGKVGDITDEEEKVLRAAARASRHTGASVSVHLDPRGKGAFKVMDILMEESLSPDRMIMGHLDGHPDLDYHLAVADRGAFVEYDSLGREYYADNIDLAFGSDVKRVELIKAMIDAGFADQLLLSQDVCMKMDLRKYGGFGYDHIVTSGLLMFRQVGISEFDIEKMLVHNPARVLALAPSA
ncbi:MAG: hypothetical protein OXN96_02580 [Bryobacterales bacterium]|nr:hypothetical protein [Bryobacterales bacterium]MDE0336407.1 hypothetical protein [Caldilineaceae bacterium]